MLFGAQLRQISGEYSKKKPFTPFVHAHTFHHEENFQQRVGGKNRFISSNTTEQKTVQDPSAVAFYASRALAVQATKAPEMEFVAPDAAVSALPVPAVVTCDGRTHACNPGTSQICTKLSPALMAGVLGTCV